MVDIVSKDEQLREAITTAAQKIFQQYGLQKTTMEDIARAMGKGKSTLYYYFPSKEDIFQAVIEREMNDVFRKTVEDCHRVRTASEKLYAVTVTRIQASRQTANLYRTIASDMRQNSHLFDGINNIYHQKQMALYKEIITMGIDNGEFSADYRNEIDFLAYVIAGALKGFEMDWILDNTYSNLDKKLDLTLSILIKGLK